MASKGNAHGPSGSVIVLGAGMAGLAAALAAADAGASVVAIEADEHPGGSARWSSGRIWTLADFIETPMEFLQNIIDEIAPKGGRRLAEAPRMVDLAGFGQFLQNLKNQGMHPYLMGDFPTGKAPQNNPSPKRKPYLVQ